MVELKVIKKNGEIEFFDISKIIKAVNISAKRVNRIIEGTLEQKLISLINMELDSRLEKNEITVEELHYIVQLSLNQIDKAVYTEYRNYKQYKTKFNMSFENIYSRAKKLLYMSEEEKENANKNSALNSTQKSMLGGVMCNELLNYELPNEAKQAEKKGLIYIQDKDDRVIMNHNCNLYDMKNVLMGGFTMDGMRLSEASDFKTACRHISNITINASSCQYGGFTVEIVDSLKPFVEKTRQKIRNEKAVYNLPENTLEIMVERETNQEIYDSLKNLQYECNLLQNAQAQTTFLTWGMKCWGDEDEKLIIENILKIRMNKMGKDKLDFIFPKIIMASHKDYNDEYIFDLAVKCTASCHYPDWLSLEGGLVGEIFERTGKIVYKMGCRAGLTPAINPYTGEEVYNGRFNIGAITILLPELAMQSKGSIDKFFELYDEAFDVSLKTHEYFYEKIGKKKASSNPLFFVEGGCWLKLKPDEPVKRALELATASFGYIGLHETSLILTGKPLHKNIEFCENIMKYMANRVEEAKKKTGHLYALYGTPSEGLSDKLRTAMFNKHGFIEGVTNKEWITNSFHVDVEESITAFEKLDIEARLAHYSPGGQISYTEWNHTDNIEALKTIIRYGMKLGLYLAVNFENGHCFDCGFKGDFSNTNCCPNCGSGNITVIDTVCGYLGFRKQNGKTRYNNGKSFETVKRKKHYNIDVIGG